jgi:hypothetical protein
MRLMFRELFSNNFKFYSTPSGQTGASYSIALGFDFEFHVKALRGAQEVSDDCEQFDGNG